MRADFTTPNGYSIPHGTERGYAAHQRYNIPSCKPCRTAHAEYQAQWRRSRNDVRIPKRVSIPLELFTELYLNCGDIAVQARTETVVGPGRLSNYVAYHDGEFRP